MYIQIFVYVSFQASEIGSKFIDIWLESYNTYLSNDWATNSCFNAHKLAALFPHLLHIQPSLFPKPSWSRISDLYLKNEKLSASYAVHLYIRELHYIPDSMQALDGYDCTVGAAMRRVLYDTENLRTNDVKSIAVGRRLPGAVHVRDRFND